MNSLNVLSLFDGISCGQLALLRANIPILNYFASEVDKYAIKVTQNNFPNTIQLGDVRNVSINEKIDLLIGGVSLSIIYIFRKKEWHDHFR